MSFHVCQNWRRKRALVYRSGCSHCNNGLGKRSEDSGHNGRWHGPFDSRDTAVVLMQSFGYAVCGFCRVCNP
jgi:hypothetical protein